MTENNTEAIAIKELADNLPGIVFHVIVRPDGTLQPEFVCEEAAIILGFDPAEIQRDPSRLLALVPAEEREEFRALLVKSRAAKQKIKREILIDPPGGLKRWLRIEALPRSRPDAEGDEWFGVALDVTKARTRERELEETKLLLEGVLASIEDAVFVIGPPQRNIVKSANAAVAQIFGYRPEDLVGRPTEILHTSRASFEEFGRRTERVLNTGRSYHGEYQMRRRNGEIFPSEHVITMLNRKNWREGVVSVVRDITERKRAEENLKGYAERLKILRDTERAIVEVRLPVQIARTALVQINKLIPYDWASVLLYNSENQKAKILASAYRGQAISEKHPPLPFDSIFEGSNPLSAIDRIIHNLANRHLKSPLERRLTQLDVHSYIIVSLKVGDHIIGAIYFGNYALDSFKDENFEVAKELADSLAIAIHNAQLMASEESHRRRLQALAGRLIDTEERMRKEVAQELHDRVGQHLTALNINLKNLERMHPPGIGDEAKRRLADSLDLVEETMARIRDLMTELRPPVLDDYGLAAALRWHGEKFSERTGVRFDLQTGQQELRLQPALEVAMFRIFQEALTNVAKHAKARQVVAVLRAQAGKAFFRIRDDGQGFSASTLGPPGDLGGWGLMTMRERISAFGGKLSIESIPGEGTTIEIIVKI